MDASRVRLFCSPLDECPKLLTYQPNGRATLSAMDVELQIEQHFSTEENMCSDSPTPNRICHRGLFSAAIITNRSGSAKRYRAPLSTIHLVNASNTSSSGADLIISITAL
jgi:hypothetical protein